MAIDEQRAQPTRRVTEQSADRRKMARWMFHLHLWFGIVTTAMLLIVAATGVLLNHKRGLGLMPDIPHEPSGSFDTALPLARLAGAASDYAGTQIASAGIDRMDVRPGDGIVKVRFKDDRVTEVDVDINNAKIVGSDARNDVFLEKLHSGEIFGKRWVLLSDIAAVGLAIALITGVWLWLFPKSRL
ncbi:MAG: PepSY domain-containing protein [Longimicrobiales bacterium]